MRQITNTVMMVRPASFGYNEETAQNNAFQVQDDSISDAEISQKAVQEFDDFVRKLQDVGIDVTIVNDTPEPKKPDAVFPNNWVSFHEDGTVYTYPMYSPKRRKERSQAIIDQIREKFEIKKTYGFEFYEDEELFLEGTGSMVLDRENKIVYACYSQRTDATLLEKFCVLAGYEKVAFISVDQNGQDIYHTNVMMAMGLDFVVICMDSVTDEAERQALLHSFEKTNKTIVEISIDQMNQFAGNMMQLQGGDRPVLVMSEAAFRSLTPEQVDLLKSKTDLLYADISTIEKYGGGSVRCMIAEVFLSKKS